MNEHQGHSVSGRARGWFGPAAVALTVLGLAPPLRAQQATTSNAELRANLREMRAGDVFVQVGSGAGYMSYDQSLQGGYVVGGVPYDVFYSGISYALDASAGYFLSPHFGLGAELAYLGLPSPRGEGHPQTGGPSVTRDAPNAGAFGYGAVMLALRPITPLRFSGLVGYLGGNAPSTFGGSGPLFGLGADYLVAAVGNTCLAIGAEADYTLLSDPEHAVGSAIKRAEHGPLLSARLRVSLAFHFSRD